jgi:hypothetical protein
MASILSVTDDGARSDMDDCTDVIQYSLNKAAVGDTVVIPSGVFKVDAVRSVRPRSGTNLVIDGTLQALPDDQNDSAVVALEGVEQVNISGSGGIIGNRYNHLGSQGPDSSHGHGVRILNSKMVTVSGIYARSCWADGYYVQGCSDINLTGVLAHDSRRNGLSIIAVERMKVFGSTFSSSNGPSPLPQCGIDVEPDFENQNLLDLHIAGNTFIKNKGAGVYLAFDPSDGKGKTKAIRTRVFVTGNIYDQHYKDGSGPPIGGKNTPLCNFVYATMRWMPGYDWWFFPKDFTSNLTVNGTFTSKGSLKLRDNNAASK